jgi:hypothetical protein
MTKAELLALLTALRYAPDPGAAHDDADKALLDYIHDVEITAAYNAVPKGEA